jgi:hypothetical protein
MTTDKATRKPTGIVSDRRRRLMLGAGGKA